MKKHLISAILLTGIASTSFAQSGDVMQATATTNKGDKMFEHQVGVQINGLINQVFNFSNTTPATSTNPYLLTYNINSVKSGWGLRVGLGYTYGANSTNNGVNTNTSNINDGHFRLGIEKRFKLADNWTAGAGADFVYNTNNDNTTATTIAFDTVTTTTKTVVSSYGGGVMAWLRYNVTKNLTIGTETSFYYTTGKQKITIDINSTNSTTLQPPSVTDNKVSNGAIALPIVFYLAVKF